MPDILKAFLPRTRAVDVPAADAPRLLVVVDTEEEFDWSAPPSRSNTSTRAMRHVGRAQQVLDRFGLRPTYVVDYPVASQPEGYEPLLAIWKAGGCEIGAHLHPWVNPPYSEPVTGRNTFMMNLPESLQREKLEVLTEAIAARFEQPRVFKAGRYGLGRATVGILEQLGYLADTSVCPRMDFSELDGPSFASFDASPFMLTNRLMEVPCTVDYIGWMGHQARALHTAASHPALRRLRGVGVLARTGAVNRVMLSPEGNTLAEMCALSKSLVQRGCKVFTLSFHSPSVEPGHTPYVRTQRDLDDFLARLERFCEFFMVELGGVPDSTLGFFHRMSASTGLIS